MLSSMTGFGSKEAEVVSLGRLSVEVKSSNHKFLEIALHLPEGFLALEERIKKEIEARLKRGRIVCVVNLSGRAPARVFVNHRLIKNYLAATKVIQKNFRIKEDPRIDTLINLPGAFALTEGVIAKEKIWPHLKRIIDQALDGLVQARQREGKALARHLTKEARSLTFGLERVKARFKKAVQLKAARIKIDEERSAFLKDSDITEEIERLAYHLKSFLRSLLRGSPVGKELDFIAQEMQREANTIGAKSCDSRISAEVVQLKSRIEKIREQAQNVE